MTLHRLSRDFHWQSRNTENLRRLSRSEAEQYDALGYIRLEKVFSAQELAKVEAAIDPLESEVEERVRQRGGQISITSADVITFTSKIVSRSPVLEAFARHQAIKEICHDLVGTDVRLYWDQSVYKKTGKVQEFPWHQDNGYAFVEPQQYLTLWIPLVDVDELNGCPWVAPGFHRQGTLEHWHTEIGLKCLDNVANAVCVPARKGDVIAFSSLTPHRTGPNLRPGSIRKAYILQYANSVSDVVEPNGTRRRQDDPKCQFSILLDGM